MENTDFNKYTLLFNENRLRLARAQFNYKKVNNNEFTGFYNYLLQIKNYLLHQLTTVFNYKIKSITY